MLCSSVLVRRERGKKLICPLMCWGGGGCGACFLPHVPDMLASCPILGRAAHTTEMAWSHASATRAALIPALCPPWNKIMGLLKTKHPLLLAGLQSWIISLLLSWLLVLSQQRSFSFGCWMDPCIRPASFSSLYMPWLALGFLRACRVHWHLTQAGHQCKCSTTSTRYAW